VYAVTTVDPCLSTIDEQLELDVAQQDPNKLQQAFAVADAFARRLDKQLNNRKFICGSSLVSRTISFQLVLAEFIFIDIPQASECRQSLC